MRYEATAVHVDVDDKVPLWGYHRWGQQGYGHVVMPERTGLQHQHGHHLCPAEELFGCLMRRAIKGYQNTSKAHVKVEQNLKVRVGGTIIFSSVTKTTPKLMLNTTQSLQNLMLYVLTNGVGIRT